MSRSLSESTIVREVAGVACARIARKTIADLKRTKNTRSGDDSDLKTTWDEICVQVQDEHSVTRDAYEKTVRSVVSTYAGELVPYEREAIWLQTKSGIEWDSDDLESREDSPVFDDEIIDYITTEHVYAEADRYTNSRIRNFLDRTTIKD
jgi:hypothetical protein